jgi:hypothetical protein
MAIGRRWKLFSVTGKPVSVSCVYRHIQGKILLTGANLRVEICIVSEIFFKRDGRGVNMNVVSHRQNHLEIILLTLLASMQGIK